jgi:RNA polymerase sigma factor (sigma-70 family)
MEANTATRTAGTGTAGLRPRLASLWRRNTPLLRLQSDESLVALTRSGNQAAFEALVRRYRPRLIAFCAQMLGTAGGRDAEDVVQESLVAAYTTMIADERSIEVRPWLYRIARNRCLNHLRGGAAATARPVNGDGTLAPHPQLSEGGLSAADQAGRREELRRLVRDMHELPESQRSALILRELEAMSYKQVAEAMSTTVPSVKSLLVRARLSLVDTAQGRELPCSEVRYALAQHEEGIRSLDGAERAHLKACPLCADVKKRLTKTSSGLGALAPSGLLTLFHRFVSSKLGGGTAAGTTGSQIGAGGLSTGAGALATKAVAVALLAATVFTTGGHHVAAPPRSAAPSAGTAIPAGHSVATQPMTHAPSAPKAVGNETPDATSPPTTTSPPPTSSAPPAQLVRPASATDGSAAVSVTSSPTPSDSDAATTTERGRTSPIGDEPTPRGRSIPDSTDADPGTAPQSITVTPVTDSAGSDPSTPPSDPSPTG